MATADEIVDYAMPLMNIERMAKEIYNECLADQLRNAEEIALKLGVEVRVLQATLAIMQSKETMR
jgi:hypothetical protein